MENIKTVIFDLGGVIIDLAPEKTISQFAALSELSPEEVLKLYHAHPTFHRYEKGLIDSQTFRAELRELFDNRPVTDDELDQAWNAMLIKLPVQKLELLRSLKDRYQVMILSNTNEIHIDHVHKNMLAVEVNEDSFEPFVHHVYFSHHLHMRKPDLEIYQHLLDEHNLVPEETAFLDDNPDNVEGAAAVGIKGIHIQHPDKVYDIF